MGTSTKERKSTRTKGIASTTPARLTFEAWRKRFDQFLNHGGEPWKVLNKWIEKDKSFRESEKLMWEDTCNKYPGLKNPIIPQSDEDTRTDILKGLYRQTCPPDLNSMRKRKNETKSILKALSSLAKQMETFVARVRRRPGTVRRPGTSIQTVDGYFHLDLTFLLKSYERAVIDSQYVLSVIPKTHVHEPNLVRQSLYLFNTLTRQIKVTDEQALKLIGIAFRAHGHSEDRLTMFLRKDATQTRTVRKRAETKSIKAIAALTEMLYAEGKYSQAALRSMPFTTDPTDKK